MSLGEGGTAAATGGTGAGTSAGSTGTGSGGGGSTGGNASGSTPASGSGTPPPASSIGTGAAAGETKTWRDTLPDDLKSDPTLNKYSDVQNLAKAHLELTKKFGQKGIFKPAADAQPEEIKAFREALGIPTDPAKYDMGAFEGVKIPPETLTWAQNLGAQHGVEPQAMKAIMSEYFKLDANNQVQSAAAKTAKIKQDFDGLRKEWGDGFERNIQRANFGAERAGGKELIDALKKYGADNDPTILKAFAKTAEWLGEDKLREAGAGSGRQTPAELQGELKRVQAELFSLKKDDGRRPAVLERWTALNRQMTAGK